MAARDGQKCLMRGRDDPVKSLDCLLFWNNRGAFGGNIYKGIHLMSEETTEVCGTAKWTFTAGDVKVEVEASIVDGEVVFKFKLVEGTADLNGAFFDWDGKGGKVKSVEGEKANNMNGSDTDGNKIAGFDEAYALGSVGGNDDDYTGGKLEFNLKDIKIKLGLDPEAKDEDVLKALAENTIIGIRATSVGDDREDSLKMTATGDYCPPDDGKDDDWFPDFKEEFSRDISNVVVYFNIGEGEDCVVYTVKIDNWEDVRGTQGNDLDDSWDAILAYIIKNDDNITEKTPVLGAAIKGGQEEEFFGVGEYDTSGDTGADGLPCGLEGLITDNNLDNDDFNAVDVFPQEDVFA
jgi:hypothetical protein